MEAWSNGALTLPQERPWPPPLGPAARIGALGDFLALVEPETEADPAAIALTVLVYFGNALNNGPHFVADGSRHAGNLFAVIVGSTATGRKGTAEAQARRLFEIVEPEWAKRITGGASSGEGIIHHVRDETDTGKRDRDGNPIVEPGVKDKRLLVYEPEFARVFVTGRREGSTLSMVLRQAWDGSRLNVMTKSPYCATGAHVSLLGHVTPRELMARIDDQEFSSGTANRILWCLAHRHGVLPFGGKVDAGRLAAIGQRFRQALDTARRRVPCVEFARQAEPCWPEAYERLTCERPGRLGEVTARAVAQVRRLAMLYALLDSRESVDRQHLAAGLEFWRYCEGSARYLFGSVADRVRDTIAQALRESRDGLDRENIQNLLGRREDRWRIDEALNAMQAEGEAKQEKQQTGGRPRTLWRWTGNGETRHGTDESHERQRIRT